MMTDVVTVLDGFSLGQEEVPDHGLKIGLGFVSLPSACTRLPWLGPVLNNDRQVVSFKFDGNAEIVVLLFPERDRIKVVEQPPRPGFGGTFHRRPNV